MAFFTQTEFLTEWEEWRTVADRYRLDRRRPWPVLAAAVSQFIADDVNAPFDLAALEASAVELMLGVIVLVALRPIRARPPHDMVAAPRQILLGKSTGMAS